MYHTIAGEGTGDPDETFEIRVHDSIDKEDWFVHLSETTHTCAQAALKIPSTGLIAGVTCSADDRRNRISRGATPLRPHCSGRGDARSHPRAYGGRPRREGLLATELTSSVEPRACS